MPRKETNIEETTHRRVWKRSSLSRTSINSCKLTRKTTEVRGKKRSRRMIRPRVSCLQPYGRKRKDSYVAPRRFFISSGFVTGYNRFDRPIHQVIGRRRVWNLISRAFVGVFVICALFVLRPIFMYGNEKIDDNYTRTIIDFLFLYFFHLWSWVRKFPNTVLYKYTNFLILIIWE